MMDNAQELIRAWCEGDDAVAFRRFYRHESQRLWRYLVARGVEQEQAYDLVSEAFSRFIQTVCKDPVSPSAFLFRIAQNLLIDHFRKHGRREIPLEAHHLDEFQGLHHQGPVEWADLLGAVKKLSRDEQNIVLLRYWLGMTYKELAAVIGRPEGTLRRQGATTLARLKILMAGDE
jgi:RNA polymerase sigma-70 factor (ECF subfamily)